MLYMACDPGALGGIVILDEKGNIVYSWVMPYYVVTKKAKNKKGSRDSKYIDVKQVKKLLLPVKKYIKVCYYEEVGAMPKNGAVSMFTFGHNSGVILGLLEGLNIRVELVKPKIWQERFHKGLIQPDPKERSLIAAKRVFEESALQQENGKFHDGIIDAALIARYGWLKERGK